MSKEQAKQLKEQGNKAFTDKKYDDALKLYTDAIENDPTDHTLFSNRSGCFANLNKFNEALVDAKKCLQIKPDFVRGFQRKGYAEFCLNRYKAALDSYSEGLKLDPNNAQLKEGVQCSETKLKEGPSPGMNNQMNELMNKLMNDPKTKGYFSQPDFIQKLSMMGQNPLLMMQLMQTDKRFADVFEVLTGMNMKDLEKKAQEHKHEHKPGEKCDHEHDEPEQHEEENEHHYEEPTKEDKPEPPKKETPKPKSDNSEAEAIKLKGTMHFLQRHMMRL